MRLDRVADVLHVEVDSEVETGLVGRAIAEEVAPGVVIGLVGPLGAGKTRMSRAIAEGLGVDPGAIASPTFVLIHEYDGRIPVYHADTYRLDDPDAFDSLGLLDDSGADGLCLIEWADRVANLLPPSSWQIALEPTGTDSRRIVLRAPELVLERIAARLSGD